MPGTDVTLQHLAPGTGEAAVLSAVLVRSEAGWSVVCGSLLTMPVAMAQTSWKRWDELQPPTRGPRYDGGGFDLGPTFCAEPSPGVRALRAIVPRNEWCDVANHARTGTVETLFATCRLAADEWTSTGSLFQGGISDGERVVAGVRRPIRAIVARLHLPELPRTDPSWSWTLPPFLQPGSDLGRIARHRTQLHWPEALLGIDWMAHPDHSPPPCFVIGRVHTDAWIADVTIDHETQELKIDVGWDERRLDPLGCAVDVRCARDGVLLLARQVRISNLPMHGSGTIEPRDVPWSRRLLTVRLPRGPRRSDWGVALVGPDGWLLDERPVAPRYESFSIAIHVDGSETPTSVTEVGDHSDGPTAGESDDAVELARRLEEQAQVAAARRRISTSGAVEDYIQSRLSYRAGELLVLDPHLLDDKPELALAFLARLDRPVRALTRSVSPENQALVDGTPRLDVRALPSGRADLHDRVWIVGETGLLVGASVGSFLSAQPRGRAVRTTTVTELPHADSAAWRDQFEQWWGT